MMRISGRRIVDSYTAYLPVVLMALASSADTACIISLIPGSEEGKPLFHDIIHLGLFSLDT